MSTRPQRETAPTDKRRSVLSEGILVKGNLTSEGIVEVGGTLEGDLIANTLVLAKGGRIEGNIRANIVTIEGQIRGSISALQVAIKQPAHVEADITAEQISVASGAFISGLLNIKGNLS